MNNTFELNINDFNGPLDLLLHLIKESKMDIYNLKIEEITKQYVDYIESQNNLNIDIASEYLVMASTLIHLKSKRLINDVSDTDEESEEEINSEDDLKRRLLEYQAYKEVTENLKELEDKRSEVYTKLPENLTEYKEEDKISTDTSLDDLIKAFEQFLDRQKYNKPLDTKITTKELSVTRRSKEIKLLLGKHKHMNFLELFDKVTKPYVVVTFLSILEMAKDRELSIRQDKNFASIIVEAR